MASTTMNGPTSPSGKYIDSIDIDDPEYQRQMRRPAEVKEDLTQMDNRSRVKIILNSQAFREELEQIIENQLSSGHHPASLLALQQITDLLLPHTRGGGVSASHATPVIPINDIRGVESLSYQKNEKALRCKLASLFRVVDMNGWTNGVYNHITARIDQEHEHFLIQPFGLLYSEVTAASLVKIDMQGQVVDAGSTPFGINQTGFTLHSAIHAARPDIKCVIHLHTAPIVAVSSMKCGLLPVSQDAMCCGPISYHDYNGLLVDVNEREAIARNLGPTSMVLILRNHGVAACGRTIEEALYFTRVVMDACKAQVSAMKCGLLPATQEAMICGTITYTDYTGLLADENERDALARNLGPTSMVLMLRNHGAAVCGRTIEEAFYYALYVMDACKAQVSLMPAGLDNIIIPSEEVQQETFRVATSRGGGGTDTSGKRWRTGEMEFEALMRQLDNAGFRTGHTYHVPLVKYEKKDRATSDVEIPPSASSFTYEDGVVMSPLKIALERQKQSHKVGWLNTPNTYTKKEIDEIGTNTPKKITKWVSDGEGGGADPIKVETPNVFAPQGENPKEYRDKQKEIRKDYYTEKISAGPQSRILEGVTYEEAEKMRDGNLSGTADTVVVVGAASKGIIQRDHQHNVAMYKTTYAANPFENVSEDDLKTYQKQVEGVTISETDDLSPGPEGRLISTDERMLNIQTTRIEGGDAPVSTEIDEPVALEVLNGDADATDMGVSVEEHPIKDVEPKVVLRQSRETLIDDPTPTPKDDPDVRENIVVSRTSMVLQTRQTHTQPPYEQRIQHRPDDSRVPTDRPRYYHDSVDGRPSNEPRDSRDDRDQRAYRRSEPPVQLRQRGRQSQSSLHDDDAPVSRHESTRDPRRSKELIQELEKKNLSRSLSDRQVEKPSSPTKSTDSQSADTLDDRSSKESSDDEGPGPGVKGLSINEQPEAMKNRESLMEYILSSHSNLRPSFTTQGPLQKNSCKGQRQGKGSPTKEQPPAAKDKDKAKKKKKFRIPSFSKKKKEKEHKGEVKPE